MSNVLEMPTVPTEKPVHIPLLTPGLITYEEILAVEVKIGKVKVKYLQNGDYVVLESDSIPTNEFLNAWQGLKDSIVNAHTTTSWAFPKLNKVSVDEDGGKFSVSMKGISFGDSFYALTLGAIPVDLFQEELDALTIAAAEFVNGKSAQGNLFDAV